ncbi:hypothetical protein [uncultured Nevskia sp.]|uniref:hypothetical protein n=1 Tax=uncultured Nevskia sp. TaxID=228950 RepID=UPI0025D82C2E|nr:hypothetical protein [uncultured Nevskia sp.]
MGPITPRTLLAALLSLGTLPLAAASITDVSNNYVYTTVDMPGAASITAVNGLNDFGRFVGVYDDAAGNYHAFQGRIGVASLVKVDYPGAVQTFLISIANDGAMAGTWFDTGGAQHGFVLRNGRYTSIDIPQAAAKTTAKFELGAGLGSSVYGLNTLGDVVGQYADKRSVGHGFRLRSGIVETIDAPDAGNGPGFDLGGTNVVRISEDGTMAGYYQQLKPALRIGFGRHGFVLRGGRFEIVDAPQAVFTQVLGLSNDGCVTGVYATLASLTLGRGFVYCGGRYSRILHPDGFTSTSVASRNVSGVLSGEYAGADNRTHGFIAMPK